MEKVIKKFLSENNLIGKTVLLGYSTGVDSTVLLHLLSKQNLRVIALYFNHGWRLEADEEAEFAKDFCVQLGVEFYTEKNQGEIKKTETSAREKRYDFFERCIQKFSADAVFLAHNREDNIETLIYRIAKGTGLEGLKCIAKIRKPYYRPLLNISKREIEKYAKENNLEFKKDMSNDDTKYKRNFIRHKVLPILHEINPTCMESMENLIKIANFGCKIIEDKMREVENEIILNNKIDTQKFLKLDYEYKIEIIQRLVSPELKNPRLSKIEQIVDFIKLTASEEQDPQFRKWKKFSINSTKFLYVNKKEIFVKD